MDNKLLSVEEASNFLHVTEVHFREMIEKGQIPYVNVALPNKSRKSIRIEMKALEEFVAKGGNNE